MFPSPLLRYWPKANAALRKLNGERPGTATRWHCTITATEGIIMRRKRLLAGEAWHSVDVATRLVRSSHWRYQLITTLISFQQRPDYYLLRPRISARLAPRLAVSPEMVVQK